MNAPLRWPNRWLSARSLGTAVQLKATNGRLARADAPWTTRATISLPVPVSPVRSTVIDIPATRRALATIVVISLLQKMKSSGGSPASIGQRATRSRSSLRALRSKRAVATSRSIVISVTRRPASAGTDTATR